MISSDKGSAPIHFARKPPVFLIKVSISAAVIIVLFNRISFSQILSALKAYPVSSLWIPLALYIVFGFWASIKWKILLPGMPFGELIAVSFARYFFSLIGLGTVTGDIARGYILAKQTAQRGPDIAASIIVDRVTGFIGLAVTGIAGIIASSMHIPAAVSILCLSALTLCLITLFSLRLPACYKTAVSGIRNAGRIFRPLGKFATVIERFIDAIHVYVKQSRLMLLSIAAGVVSQALCIAAICLLGKGLGLTVSPWDWSWIFCVVSLTVLIPITVSGLGIREGSFVALLSLVGVHGDKAMTVSLLVFCLDIILGILGWISQIKTAKKRLTKRSGETGQT